MSTFFGPPKCMSLTYNVKTKLSDPEGGWCCFPQKPCYSYPFSKGKRNQWIRSWSRLVPTSRGHVWSSKNLFGFSMAPKYPIHLKSKEHPRYLALLHFRLRIAALGPQPTKIQPNQRKTWLSHVATPQSFTSKVMYSLPCASQLPPQPKTLKFWFFILMNRNR